MINEVSITLQFAKDVQRSAMRCFAIKLMKNAGCNMNFFVPSNPCWMALEWIGSSADDFWWQWWHQRTTIHTLAHAGSSPQTPSNTPPHVCCGKLCWPLEKEEEVPLIPPHFSPPQQPVALEASCHLDPSCHMGEGEDTAPTQPQRAHQPARPQTCKL